MAKIDLPIKYSKSESISALTNAYKKAKSFSEKQDIIDQINDVKKNAGYAKGGLTSKQQEKVATVMGEFKKEKLHSGKGGKVVKNPKQAIAIALSEAKKVKKK